MNFCYKPEFFLKKICFANTQGSELYDKKWLINTINGRVNDSEWNEEKI